MNNPFDQFDTSKSSNPFDQFDTPRPEESAGGAIKRGAKEAFQQLPQLGYGLMAGAGAAAETAFGEGGIASGIKKAGIKGYEDWGQKIAKDSRESDSWDYSYDKAKEGDFGALVGWLSHGLGYVSGQAVQTLATGGIGALGGKFVAGTAAKEIAAGMVAKETARLTAESAGKNIAADVIAKEAVKNVAGKFASIGMTAATGANAVGMEGGEIFGDLTASNKDRALTGSELGKAFASTLAAGGLEFVGDKLGLDLMLGKSKLLKPANTMAGMSGRAARGLIAGGAAAPIEAGTEYLQTGLEEFGKGKEENILPFNQSEAGQKQAREAAMLGALGGTVVGGGSGAFRGAEQKPATAPAITPEATAAAITAPNITSVDQAIAATQAALTAGSQWQELTRAKEESAMQSQLAQAGINLAARTQEQAFTKAERAGAEASRARDQRLNDIGQQWQALGITDPADDLQAQRMGMRPTESTNGAIDGTGPIPATSSGQDGNQPAASVGLGSTDGNGLGANAAGSESGAVGQSGEQASGALRTPVAQGRQQPTTLGTQTSANAGPGFSAKDVQGVKNQSPAATDPQAGQAPVEAPTAVESNAATTDNVPGAGSVAVEGGGVDEGLVVTQGKGLIKGKFLSSADGSGTPGGPWATESEALNAAKDWREKRKQDAATMAADLDRKNRYATKLRSGHTPTSQEVEGLGLRAAGSELTYFIPRAAELFGITSRQVRPLIADLIRVGTTDMGSKIESVNPIKALAQIAKTQSTQDASAANRAKLKAKNTPTIKTEIVPDIPQPTESTNVVTSDQAIQSQPSQAPVQAEPVSRADIPNDQKPDATPEQVADVNEAEYQQSIKESIKQRLGLAPATEEDQRKTPFKSFLREHGIASTHVSDIAGRNRFRANQMLPATFRANGLSLDSLVEKAIERGFMQESDRGDQNKLIGMIQDEIAGKKQVSSEFSDEDAAAQHERVQRMEIESLADKLGLPYSTDISTDRLASMVNRVQSRLEKEVDISFNGRGSLKSERVLANARETVARIERKRAQYERESADFAKASIEEQDALLELLHDEDGNPAISRKEDRQAVEQWYGQNPTWTNQNESDAAATKDQGQAGAPDARAAQERAGDGRQVGPQEQRGSDQAPAGQEEGIAQPLYASRAVTNAADIITWAQSQGFKTTLPADDMHVTVAYSSKPVDGGKAGPTAQSVSIVAGKRTVEPLGDAGAIVLKFSSDELQTRWKQYRDAGASWDYEGYTPHVTLTYDGAGVDLSKVTPYSGVIQLGAEKQEALNEDKKSEYKEEPTLTAPSREDILAQQARAEKAAKDRAKADKDADEKAKAERIAKEIAARQRASSDNFQLGQSAEEGLSGQGSIFDAPAEPKAKAATPAKAAPKTPSAAELRAQADLQAALADLGDIFGKNTRLNMMPEQEAKILPVMVKLFDAAFRLGYIKFKDAAKFALDKIRAALGDSVANDISLEHLQGAYISMSSGKTGTDSIRIVSNIEAKSEIESHTAQTDNERNGETNVPSTNPSVERDSTVASTEPAEPAAQATAILDAADITGKGVAMYSRSLQDEQGNDYAILNDPSADEAQAVQSGIEGKTAVEAAQFIAENAPSESHRAIAAKVAVRLQQMESFGKRFTLNVAHVDGQVPSTMIGAAIRGQVIQAVNDPVTHIWVQGADVSGKVGTSFETVLHELLHAATQKAIDLGDHSATGELALYAKELRAAWRSILLHIKAKADANQSLNDFEQQFVSQKNNSLENIHELVSWALTNKETQDYLETIPYKNSTVWGEFVAAIRRFLGLKSGAETVLSEVLRVSDKLLSVDAGVLMLESMRQGIHMQVNYAGARTLVNSSQSDASLSSLNNKLASEHGEEWSNAYALDNTRSARNLDTANAFKEVFGVDVVAIRPRQEQFNVFGGMQFDGKLYVNTENGRYGFMQLAGHELLHKIRRDNEAVYQWFAEQARAYYVPGAIERYGNRPEMAQAQNEDFEEELLGDFVGDALADASFVARLEKTNPGKFKQLLNTVVAWLKDVANKLTGAGFGSSQSFTDVDELRGYLIGVLDAYKATGEVPRAINDGMTNNDVVGNQGGRSADDTTPGGTHPFNGFTREQFLGNPKITSDANAKDLVPSTWKSLESEKNVPFAIGSGLTARYSELSAAVYNEKGDVVASYSSGDTLVVNKKYRRQGIGSELVYQWRMRNPNSKTAATRTKKSQLLQEKVWNRIRSERALYESRIHQDSNEPTAPDSGGVKYSRTKIVGQTNRQHTPEQLRAMKNVGFQVEVPTLKERAQALWKDAGKKMAQGIADQFAPIKDLNKEAYGLMRLAKGASGAFEVLLKGGQLKLTDNVYDTDTANKGGVVDKLLIPLQGEHHDFMRWVAANRAERLQSEGKENLFSPQDIADLKTLASGTAAFDYTIQNGAQAGTVTRDRTLIYADSLKTFNAFNKNVLDMAEQSGLIDGESRKLWEHEFYVPFYRVADDADGGVRGMNIKGGAVRQQAFKQLKGGKQALNADLLDNTLLNWAHLLDASAKNRGAKATIEAAEAMGIAIGGNQATLQQMGSSINNKNGVVWFMDGGVKRYSLVDDPFVFTALTSLEYAGMRNPVMNAMGAMKHALTIGVTASPFFKVRNLIRDSVQVIGTGNISYNPVKNVAEGWKLTDPKSDAYFRLLAGGGTIHFGTMMEGSEAKRVQALVESGVNDSTILNNDHKVKAFYRKFIEPGVTAYNELGNRGEAINRAALYDQLRKQGVNHADASLQARDLMDFSMQGSFTTIRFLTQVVPFLNARIQGLYKLGRAAKEDPARFSAVLGATAVMSVLLLAAYGDDDDWKKRTESDRNNFWWFKFGGTAFRIPKPFEIGAIATLAERGFELAFDKEMTGTRFRKQVLTLLGDNLSMNPIPQAVKPILDVYANKDSFSGMPIESMGMDKLKSEYRFNDRTSMTARGMSTAANAVTGVIGVNGPSPVQIDHMLRGYFGWLGSFVVGSADLIARPTTGQVGQATPDYWKVATGNMVSDLRDAPSRYVAQMYDQAKEIEQVYGTYRMLQNTGKTQEAAEFMSENRETLQKYRNIEHVKRAEAKLNERIRIIERSNMERDAKRDLIRSIKSQKDRVARAAA